MSKGSRSRVSNKKKFDDNYYDIYGNECKKCGRRAAKDKLYCTKCEEGL